MTFEQLPVCCPGGQWVVRDSARRYRELIRRGFSSLPRIATCTKCGTVKFIDPGLPDEEFVRRRNARRHRRENQKKD